mmetsp:Transcript_23981/g.69356  ORF Transcript_23981/g.69356 Transcript_23981/m.69356 type:complete len:399 (-) Transcript_23981:2083-3279(-)
MKVSIGDGNKNLPPRLLYSLSARASLTVVVMRTRMVRRHTRNIALWWSAGSAGCAGAPHTSATVSPVCSSRRGYALPTIGYLQTKARRRSITARKAAATLSRRFPPDCMLGMQAEIATAMTSAGSGNAARTEVPASGAARIAATQLWNFWMCPLLSSVTAESTQAQSPERPPTSSTARPNASRCHRKWPHDCGGGSLSCCFADNTESIAAAPPARGRDSPGDARSRASKSVGAVNGLKSALLARDSSPASARGSAWSIQPASASAGPSNAQARQRRWASSAPRKACANLRRNASVATATARRPRLSLSQSSANKPAAATAWRSLASARFAWFWTKAAASFTTVRSSDVSVPGAVVDAKSTWTARALCSSASAWFSVAHGRARQRPSRLRSWRSDSPAL